MKIQILLSAVALMLCTTHVAFAETQTAMDPAMMEKMQALMAPGPEHEILKNFVGEWTYAGEFKMTSGSEPEMMEGTASHELINGGRFLSQEYRGDWMGREFLGTGYVGYDNVKKEYVSIWFDNMSTGIMSVTGAYDPGNNQLLFSGTHSCPMTGEEHRKYRSEWKIVDENTNIYSAYSLDAEGNEFKGMEIIYSRA